MIIDLFCILISYIAVLIGNTKLVSYVQQRVLDRYLNLCKEGKPKPKAIQKVFSDSETMVSIIKESQISVDCLH